MTKPNQKNKKQPKKQNHGGAGLGKTWVVFFCFLKVFYFLTKSGKNL